MARDHLFTGETWLKEQKLIQPEELRPTPIKYVFLDIDGVLNSSGSCLVKTGPIRDSIQMESFQHLHMVWADEDFQLDYRKQDTIDTADPTAVALMTRLLVKGHCKLVMSSSHRYSFRDHPRLPCGYNSKEHRTWLALYLQAMGLGFFGELDITPDLHCERGHEVDMYIENVLQDGDKYVIIDDGADFFSHQNLVKTDPTVGFTHTNYLECCKILGIDESSLIY